MREIKNPYTKEEMEKLEHCARIDEVLKDTSLMNDILNEALKELNQARREGIITEYENYKARMKLATTELQYRKNQTQI